MKLNRKWILIMSLVLSIALATTGTLAYLTDSDADVNVMTLGKVSIEQHEYERVVNADGTYKIGTVDGQDSYILKEFTQLKPLLPIVGDPSTGEAGWDPQGVRMSQVGSYGSMSVFAGKVAQDKFVTVENTGRSDAYVRTYVALEAGKVSAEEHDKLIGTSYHKTWTKNEIGICEIDNKNYFVIEYTYAGAELDDGTYRHKDGILPAGDTSYPNLSQVYMNSIATNDDVEALDGNKNGLFDILVLTQAVQASGFDAVKDAQGNITKPAAQVALEAGFGEATAANVQKWFGDLKAPVIVENAEALTEALEGNGNVVLSDDIEASATASSGYGKTGVVVEAGDVLDGAGNTYTVNGANDTWDSAIAAKGGTIKNLTVANGFRGIFMPGANADLYIENVDFKDVVYTFNSDAGSKEYGVYISDSTLNGWTSYSNVHKEVVFTNCEFGAGGGNAFLRAYNNTEFVNCHFSKTDGFTLQVVSGAVASFENCYYGDDLITAGNISTLGLLKDTDSSRVSVK